MIFGAFQGCASLWSTTHSDHYPVQSIAEVQTFSLISCQLSPTLILFKPLLITWYRVSSNPAALVVKTSLANIVWESGTIVLFAAGFLVVCKLSLQDLLFDWLIDWLFDSLIDCLRAFRCVFPSLLKIEISLSPDATLGTFSEDLKFHYIIIWSSHQTISINEDC